MTLPLKTCERLTISLISHEPLACVAHFPSREAGEVWTNHRVLGMDRTITACMSGISIPYCSFLDKNGLTHLNIIQHVKSVSRILPIMPLRSYHAAIEIFDGHGSPKVR